MIKLHSFLGLLLIENLDIFNLFVHIVPKIILFLNYNHLIKFVLNNKFTCYELN